MQRCGSDGALEAAPLRLDWRHDPPPASSAGEPLTIEVFTRASAGHLVDLTLWYRHVNQAEAYACQTMQRSELDAYFRAEIPGDYTASAYPLQYYFVARSGSAAQRYPFNSLFEDLANQAYFVVRRPT